MVKGFFIRPPNIHAWAFADRFQAFKDFNVFGGLVNVGRRGRLPEKVSHFRSQMAGARNQKKCNYLDTF
jgi:hypothetical protein